MNIATLPFTQPISAAQLKSLALLLHKRGSDAFGRMPIPTIAREGPLPLSYGQQRLWFIAQLDPDSGAYNMGETIWLRDRINAAALQSAIDSLVTRHEILRTTFIEEDGQPAAVIHPAMAIAVTVVDLRGHADASALAQEKIAAQIEQPFDLSHGPLLRIMLITLEEQLHLLQLSLHHIIADEWSLTILIEELAANYQAFCNGQTPSLASLPVQYADYAAWQRAWLDAGESERQLAYWRKHLGAEEPPLLELPADHARTENAASRGAKLEFTIPPAVADKMRALCRQHTASLFMVLLTAFALWLYRHTRQPDIRIGIPIANRSRPETERMLGFFVNTQAWRIELDGQWSFIDLLKRTKTAALGAQAHPDLPFDQLVDALGVVRDLNHNPLFQYMYNHQRLEAGTAQILADMHAERYLQPTQSTQFELILDTAELPDNILQAGFTYAADLYEPATIARFRDRFIALLEQVVNAAEVPIGRLSLADAAVIGRWRNDSLAVNPVPVHEIIANMASIDPGQIALIAGDTQLSYRALEHRSAYLAMRLMAEGVAAEMPVGVLLERGAGPVVAALAIWKAGGVLVALDQRMPTNRLQSLIAETGLVHMIVDESTQALPGLADIPSLIPIKAHAAIESNSCFSAVKHSRQLAYIIFTSGSSGKPKGVGVEHGALSLHCQALGRIYAIAPGERMLQFSSMSFDAGLEQWIVPLLQGATVVMRDEDVWSGERLLAEVAHHGITRIDLPPGYAGEVAVAAAALPQKPRLHTCVVGGEALSREILERIQTQLQPVRIFNAYGPTEGVVTPLIWEASLQACTGVYAPLGNIVGARTAYLLDPDLQLVAEGVAGELYLGDTILARGYYGQAKLTAERFIPDPYSPKGGRLYRTGDLCRLRADGNLEFLGRIDDQLKLRGYRIEPGEIEAALLALDGVREAVVELRTIAMNKNLVGYVSGDAAALDPEQIQQALSHRLPPYMVPAHIVVLAVLPRTVSGKVDRRALPEPTVTATGALMPETETEKQLAQIWCEVLGLKNIGRRDNFFALGGDSIISLQVVSRARRAGLALSPKDLFQHQTIETLARAARPLQSLRLLRPEQSAADSGAVEGDVPLTPIQEDFFATAIPARHHWNQSVLLAVSQPLVPERLAQALQHLLLHHDALRLRFVEETAGWHQFYAARETAAQQEIVWNRHGDGLEGLETLVQEAQRSLNLEQGPLIRAVYIDLGNDQYRLLLVIHHLVVDGVSWRILLEDLQQLYAQLGSGAPVELPAKTALYATSYKAWAGYLLRHANTASINAQLPYWAAQFENVPADLPRDWIVSDGTQADSTSYRIAFDPEITRRLLQDCGNAYRTRTEELLITALVRTLCQWSQQPSVLIELEGHGRELLDGLLDDTEEAIDLTRTVGWFTNLYPVCLHTGMDRDAAIKSVKERLRRVPQRGMGWGLLKYLGEESSRTALQALPRPRITFNYLGQFAAGLTDNAVFRLALENRGDEQSPDAPLANWLEVNSQVYDGSLQMTWIYSQSMYRSETIEQLVHRYRDELNALIEHCTSGVSGVTPVDFPLADLTQAALDNLPVDVPAVEDIYPLSPMQQGMLFHSLDPAQANLYVSQFDIEIDGLEPARFRTAWYEVIARHAILRTGFVWQGTNQPLQVVHRTADLTIAEHGLRNGPDQAARLEALARDELAQGIALDAPPLMRLLLARMDTTRYRMIWTCHHLLLDGWSSARLLNEVLLRYSSHPLNALTGSYRDYIAWLLRQQPDAAERYWRDRLAWLTEGERTLLTGALPHISEAAAAPAADYGLYQQRLSDELARQLTVAAQACKVTLNTLIQSAWALLLQRYTGQRAVVFGATVAGRPSGIDGVEEILGLFINTIPVVVTPQPMQRCREFLQAVQAENVSAREFEHTPLFDIQRWAGMAGQALFDTLLVFENYPIDQALAELGGDAGLRFTVNRSTEHTNFPLTLAIVAGAAVEIRYGYQCEYFDEAVVARIAAHVERLLQYLVAHPDNRLADIAMHSTAEEAVMTRINAHSAATVYSDVPVYELIRAHALTQPAVPAVMDRQMALTFSELETRSNQLAAALHDRLPERNAVVGIYLERSPLFFVAALAIHKAGAAFLPLDPAQPSDRIRELIEDSGVRCAITSRSLYDETHSETASLAGVQWIAIDDIDPAEIPDATALQPQIHPQQLAYIIYTSGSTGKPKGVAVTHGALSRHIQAAAEAYGFSPADRALHFASFSFDAAIEQWMAPLVYGASVVVGDLHWDGHATAEVVERLSVTVIYPPTTHLAHLADAVAQHPRPLALRICTVGGEAVASTTLARIREVLNPDRIINGYGPTETVITPLAWIAQQGGDPCSAAYAPIGLPLGERSVYILDADLNPVIPGVAGELYIGGPCLARGYHNRPGLTAERFIPDPWGGAGARLYRTGDRVRLGADGVIEYLGRTDQQIKLRGYRIEPGEIEAALLEQAEVDEAIVVLHAGQRSPRLVAYVAGSGAEADTEPVSAEALKDRLRGRLPDYMIPAQIVLLPVLPRTRHGKVDRAALPVPASTAVLRTQKIRLPASENERMLTEVWQAVLGLEQVGIDENFFELGGDSIIAIQIVSRARQSGLVINPKHLFKYQTIEALARVAQTASAVLPAEQAPVAGDVPLTPIQAEFFATAIPNRHHWNQALLLTAQTALEPESLSRALAWLVDHHDALRLRYHQDADDWHQHYITTEEAAGTPVLWVRELASAAELEACAEAAQKSLDLQSGPLLRAVYFKIAGGQYRLLLIVHHLVVDGVSWRILLEDLQNAYTRFCTGQAPELPMKTTSFQAWSRQLRAYAQSTDLLAEANYWEEVCAGIDVRLPADDPDGSALTADYASHPVRFDREQTRCLLQDAGKAYRTRIDELMLVALARVLCQWSGRNHVHVELEGHGREAIFDSVDITRTIGWFTTTYPVKLTRLEALDASIKAIKEQLRAIPQRGLGFGILKYCSDSEAGAQLRQLPRPSVTFNYLGQFDASFDTESALFTPASEGYGADRDANAPLGNALELSGQVYGGELTLTWSYSRARYRAASIEKLALDYRKALESIIEHCLSGVTGVTPSDYPLAGLTQAEMDRMALPFEHIADLYPLSPLQQGLFYHALHEPEAGHYVNQLAIDVAGLDAERFKAAWQATVAHHTILRTGFIWEGGLRQPLQAVFKTADCRITVEDYPVEAGDDYLTALQRADHRRGFDLNDPPLMHLRLIKTGDRRYHLIWTCHHLLLDGWSGARFIEEVLARYAGANDVRAAAYSYRDYIAWLLERDHESDARYWRAQLQVLKTPTLLADALAKPDRAPGYGEQRYRLNDALASQLRACALTHRLTLNTLVQGAWALLLRRYTGQDAVVFGATVSGRPPELMGVEHIFGLFINTIPIIQRIHPEQRISEWLCALQEHNLNLREYEYTPLHEIQRWADLGGTALFDTLLVFENYPISAALTQAEGDLHFSAAVQKEPTHYGLTLTVEGQESLEFEYGYARESFGEDTIAAIHQVFEAMLSALAALVGRPDGYIGQLAEVLNYPATFIPHWVQTGYEALTVPELIARQAQKQPAARALVSGETSLSYAELDRAANRLAQRLLHLGVTRETPVGACVTHDMGVVLTALGIWKAGGVYVPVDPQYPAERLRLLIETAGLQFMITDADIDRQLPEALPVTKVPLAFIDQPDAIESKPDVVLHPAQLAYLIFTSGSTGLPKAVAVAHHAISAHCQAMAEILAIEAGECALQFSSASFDAGLEQWIVPLLHGATVVMRDAELWSAAQALDAITRHGITRLDFPPGYANEVALAAQGSAFNASLRSLTVGGEALSQAVLARIQIHLRPQRLFNAYGPTESVITPLVWEAGHCETAYAPLGKAVGARQAYVLDGDLCPVPVGVTGELYIGGRLLARGYYQQARLTAERFVPDPFSDCGARLYRTGDRCRQTSDGALEFLGRGDEQIKIRGYRVELGEVESALLHCTGVREAVAVTRDAGLNTELIAYIGGENLDQQIIRTQLQSRLPGFMVPSSFILLDQLPRTVSGKIDRRRLPKAEAAAIGREPPQGEIECSLAQIWQEVLGLERIGRHDHFFELGGHSLLAVRTVSLINARLNQPVSIAALLAAPTVARLARYLEDIRHVNESLLIALNQADTQVAPLFCLHPAGGHVFPYYALAQRFADQRPVYGIQCQRLIDPTHREASLSAMAASYLQLIKARQPTGPYFLLGWSLGGALAMEMAHQLEAAGETVAFLGLIDSYVPGFATGDSAADEIDTELAASVLQHLQAYGMTNQLSTELVAHNQAVFVYLSELAGQWTASPLRVTPYCWWSAEGGEEAARMAHTLLEQAIGHIQLVAQLPCNHSEIVHAPAVVDHIAMLLA